MMAILKICFVLLLLNRKANWLKTWYEVSGWLVDQKYLKLFWPEIPDGAMVAILKIYFKLFLLNQKASWLKTW